MSNKKARKRVARGAALLDERGPADWRSRIKPAELQMWTCCTLDHIYGEYIAGLKALGIYDVPDERPVRYGFVPTLKTPAPELRDAWIAEAAKEPGL